MQDHKTHAQFRKIAASSYSFTNVKRMEPLMDAHIKNWVRKLETKFALAGREFDVAPRIVYLVYDIVSEIGFGAPFGFIEADEDVGGLVQGFHDGLMPFGLMARLYPFTNWVKKTAFGDKYLVARPEHKSGIGTLMQFRDGLIEKRRKDIQDGKTGGRVDLLQT